MSIIGNTVKPSATSTICNTIPLHWLVADYKLTGTAEDDLNNFNGSESSATYAYDNDRGVVYDGGGSITIPNTGGLSCTYWVDAGSGWVFIYSLTIPTNLSINKYSNLVIYNKELLVEEQSTVEDIQEFIHNIPIDNSLVAYYPLDGNSLDNAISQADGTDSGVSYVYDNTLNSIVLACGSGNVSLPSAAGHVETYYWENTGIGWVHNKTTTEITSLTTNKYSNVRKYNRALSQAEIEAIYEYEKPNSTVCLADVQNIT